MLHSVLYFAWRWGSDRRGPDLIRGAGLNHLFAINLDFDVIELSRVEIQGSLDITLI